MTTAAGKRRFQLTGSALIVFVLGVVLLLLPVGCRGSSGSESASPPQSQRVNSDDIPARVRQIVAKVLKRPVSDIRDDSNYVRDFDADDLDRVEVLLAIEEEFKIEITDEEFERLWRSPVKALSAYVAARVKAKG
jgi:acyl carrier protein